jgi:hypothetical protein
MNILDKREVDDQAIVTYSQTPGVMSPASNRNAQIIFPAVITSATSAHFAIKRGLRLVVVL